VRQTAGAKIVELPTVDQEFAVPQDWAPQLKSALADIVAASAIAVAEGGLTETADLPLFEVPWKSEDPRFAIFMTGDGG